MIVGKVCCATSISLGLRRKPFLVIRKDRLTPLKFMSKITIRYKYTNKYCQFQIN